MCPLSKLLNQIFMEVHIQGCPSPGEPGLGWVRFGEFSRLVGRFCSYLCTAWPGWWNIPNQSQLNLVRQEMAHPVLGVPKQIKRYNTHTHHFECLSVLYLKMYLTIAAKVWRQFERFNLDLKWTKGEKLAPLRSKFFTPSLFLPKAKRGGAKAVWELSVLYRSP